jgi:hypothetical protein
MKKFYIIITAVILVCTFINIFFIKKSNSQPYAISKNDSFEHYQLIFEKATAYLSYFDNGESINDKIFFTSETESYTTSEFIKKYVRSTKLVFRYADVNCNTCVDSSMFKLKQLNALVRDTNIIILASYNSARDLYVWRRINNIKNPVFQIPYKSLGLKTEDLNEPYFFTLRKNSAVVQNLFIPSKMFGKASDTYLGVIKTKLLRK